MQFENVIKTQYPNIYNQAFVKCSIIIFTDGNTRLLKNYLNSLIEKNIHKEFEIIVIINKNYEIEKFAAEVYRPYINIINSGIFKNGNIERIIASRARGKYLLFVKDMIHFDGHILNESIDELENSEENMSISENKKFILFDRNICNNMQYFGDLFADYNLNDALQNNKISEPDYKSINLIDGSIFGSEALKKLLSEYSFNTVLDIGCGQGLHTKLFRKYGKKVTAVDIKPKVENAIAADYMKYNFEQMDCVWCCHVLEHQLNVNMFLRKVHSEIKEGGILAITIPPLKHQIVGGHVTLWNAGLLMYNLVLAGFDCSDIAIKTYGYNISIILKKKTIKLPADLNYDNGDLEILAQFFPVFVKQAFDGNIKEFNW